MKLKTCIVAMCIMHGSVCALAIEEPANPEDVLAVVPEERREPGPPLRKGLFWFGADGGWANSPVAEEHLTAFRQHVPDILVVMVLLNPERMTQPDFYREQNIPTLVQNYGQTYLPWYHAHEAFERDWAGRDLGDPATGIPLAGGGHATSKAHPAVWEAFERVTRSSIRHGYSGFGYHDLAWMWGGRRAAYNPATIRGFREILLGTDEGIEIQAREDEPWTMNFADYTRHYFGGMPKPQHFGVQSWEQWSPWTQEQHRAASEVERIRHDILFDMLTSYTLMRFANHMGRTAEEEGGFFQWLPNPEWYGAAGDAYWNIAMRHVHAFTDEFFQNTLYLDAAYMRWPFLVSQRSPQRQVGVVLEQGSGGNAWPYYTDEVAYMAAYEMTLIGEGDHLEGDFWVGVQRPLDNVMESDFYRFRNQTIMAFAIGFRHAYEDQLRRLPADFVSITSRNMVRPWQEHWEPWPWRLWQPFSPDYILMRNGYVFKGMDEGGLPTMQLPQDVVIYSPSIPTQQGWERLRRLVETGDVRRVITSAASLQHIITPEFERKPFHEWARLLRFEPRPLVTRDELRVARQPPQRVQFSGMIYQPAEQGWQTIARLGDAPVAVARAMGRGQIVVLLFNPRDHEELSAAIYRQLLGEAGIHPHWQSQDGTVARIYSDGEMHLVAVHSRNNRRWWDEVYARRPSQEDPNRRLPYHMPGERAEVRVRLSADADAWDWIALPSGRRGTAAAEDGWFTLSLEDVGHELFYLVPAGSGARRLDAMAQRRDAIYDAFTFGGRFEQDQFVPDAIQPE